MDTHTVQRELYRPEEAAHALGLSRTVIFRLIATGELDSVKIGSTRRIPRTAITRYVASLTGSTEPGGGDAE